MTAPSTKVPYGEYLFDPNRPTYTASTKGVDPAVRLGNSGLKVSRIILGTMQYGDKEWADWVINDEEEAFKHIKFA